MQLELNPMFLFNKRANNLQMFRVDKLFRSLTKLHLECCCYQLHGTVFHNEFNLGKASAFQNSVFWVKALRNSELPVDAPREAF